MERQLKKQIDDLLDYTLCLKNMFTRIAQSEIFPCEMTEEDKKEINNILYVMDDALEIEAKKISKIHISTSDLESLEGYLLKYHEYIYYEDFVYEENEIERLRVYNKLLYKYLSENNYKDLSTPQEIISNRFSRVIDSNFVYILDLYMKNPEVDSIYGFLKYGKIFISPTYDHEYFPKLQVSNLKPITYYQVSDLIIKKEKLIRYALREIHAEFISIIETLYNGFTNDALENDENEVRAISLIMSIITFLSTSQDPDFINQIFLEYQEIKKDDDDYTNINDMILSSLVESKRIVLKQNKRRN